jgi:putative chitinase
MPKTNKRPVKKQNQKKVTTKEVRWAESYTSLLLGAVVVVVVFVLIFSFVKSHNFNKTKETSSTSTEAQLSQQIPKKYTIKQGDDLWSISEKLYGSGYNWVDLEKANNLPNPNSINSGNELSVPKVKVIKIAEDTNNQTASQQGAAITGNKYTVVQGDFLWSIAVRAYGDGYRWVDIAKANNLENPDLIYSDNVLIIPR